ncbi:MAG: hypothetical protein J7L44_02510 [Candidatus Diapherotrites archaeon]|nr:hypothetical protein [Candidatus Diapherotrites archaeon]
MCENARYVWYSLCATKMTESECNATDIDWDGNVDCIWDDTDKECTLITGDPIAGNPPECRYEPPPLAIQFFTAFAPFFAVLFIINLVFVAILFFLQKKKKVLLRESAKKLLLIIVLDIVAVIATFIALLVIGTFLDILYYLDQCFWCVITIPTLILWLFNYHFIRAHFPLERKKAVVISIIFCLIKAYYYLFAPYISIFYVLLARRG